MLPSLSSSGEHSPNKALLGGRNPSWCSSAIRDPKELHKSLDTHVRNTDKLIFKMALAASGISVIIDLLLRRSRVIYSVYSKMDFDNWHKHQPVRCCL